MILGKIQHSVKIKFFFEEKNKSLDSLVLLFYFQLLNEKYEYTNQVTRKTVFLVSFRSIINKI